MYGGQSYVYDAEAPVTGVFDGAARAAGLALAPGAPNPVRTCTLLRFSLARDAHVRLAIFDLSGREVAALADERRAAGEHAVRWDARGVPSGVYLCRLVERGDDGGTRGPGRTGKLLVAR